MLEMTDTPLQIWREICRHPEIGTALAQVIPLLRAELPLRAVLIRRLDVGRRQLETVAEDAQDPRDLPPHAHNDYSEAQLDSVLAWCRAGQVLHGSPHTHPLLASMVPAGLRGDVMVGPLVNDSGPEGVLVLLAEGVFTTADQRRV